jgi:hypothetical protein
MQPATGVGTQANDITGVGWNFRLVEHDMEQWIGYRLHKVVVSYVEQHSNRNVSALANSQLFADISRMN